MKYITLDTPIAVKELSAKIKKQGVKIEVIAWDMELTKGQVKIPFTFEPKILKNLSGKKYMIELNKLLVKQYAIGEVKTVQSFNLSLDYKGSIKVQTLYVWI